MTLIAKAAFGDDPGRWPLPAATTPHERWLRAVAAGGQGRYGVALADLAALCRVGRSAGSGVAGPQHARVVPASARLARRRHALGRPGAGAGRRRPGGRCRRADRSGRRRARRGPVRRLGSGRWTARPTSSPDRGRHGCTVRLAWVSAELAMACGAGFDGGAARRAGGRAGRRPRLVPPRRQVRGRARRGAVQLPGMRTPPAVSPTPRWTPPNASD